MHEGRYNLSIVYWLIMRAKLKKSLKNYSFFWGSINYFENASGRRPKSGWPRVAYDGGSGVS